MNNKLENPITIYISSNEKKISMINYEFKSYPLDKGIAFGMDIFGFILIVDTGKNEKINIYKTPNKIVGVVYEDKKLKIFEERKGVWWVFDNKGKLLTKPNYTFVNNREEAIFYNPIFIEIESNINIYDIRMSSTDGINTLMNSNNMEEVLLKYDKFNLEKNVVLGDNHYGFIVKNNNNLSFYKTINRIYGVEKFDDYLKIYEDTKKGKVWIVDYIQKDLDDIRTNLPRTLELKRYNQ